MLRFFRTLRHRLLAENRVSRYLLYAVGEIFLVVIGILLALQANNWNEQQRRARELSVLFRNTDEFLEPISNWAPKMFPKYIQLDSLFRVISETQQPEFFRDHPELFGFLFNDTLTYPLKNYYWVSPGMKELIERKIDFPDSHKGLIYDLETWQIVNEDLENTNRELAEGLKQFQAELVDRAPFLLNSQPESLEKSALFVSRNEWFKFKVRALARLSGNVVGTLDWNRASLAELYGQLRIAEFQDGPRQVDSLYRNMGMSHAERLNQPQLPKTGSPPIDDTTWLLVLYNSLEHPVELELMNGEEVFRKRQIPANSFGQWSMNVWQTVRVRNRHGEAQYYKPGNGKFLIIQ